MNTPAYEHGYAQKDEEHLSRQGRSNSRKQEVAPDTSIQQKRNYFLRVPYIVLENDMNETYITGFLRFLRLHEHKGVFTGSLRKLCKLLKMARATVARMVAEWVKAGWVKKMSQAKGYEEGETMCLIVLTDELWQQNSQHYEGLSEEKQGWSKVRQSVSNLDQGVSKVNHAVSEMSQGVSDLDQTVSLASTKLTPIEGNRESYRKEYRREDRGSTLPQTEPITESALPALPSLSLEKKEENVPPLSLPEFSFEEITQETPHTWEAIFAIAEHYLGKEKCSEAAARGLVEKLQYVAQLSGPHEARRQLVSIVSFMLYSTHKSNWYAIGDRRKQITLDTALRYFDDYARKAQQANWTPPADNVPGWYTETESATATNTEQSSFGGSGMSREEAEKLLSFILSYYPGMQVRLVAGRNGHFMVALWQGGDNWIHLISPRDWDDPDLNFAIQCAIDVYERSCEQAA